MTNLQIRELKKQPGVVLEIETMCETLTDANGKTTSFLYLSWSELEDLTAYLIAYYLDHSIKRQAEAELN